MFVLEGKIEIGDFVFRAIHDLSITKSIEMLGDTCVIKLPTRFKVRQGNKLLFTEEVLKKGDDVKVTLSYQGKYEGVEFIGKVSRIKTSFPLEVHCEDLMYVLKRKLIVKSWITSVTLKDILQEITQGTEVAVAENIPEVTLDKYIIARKNGAQALEDLKKELSLTAFIDDDNKLYCGLAQSTNFNQKAVYDLNYNLVENKLEFKTSDELKLKVRYEYIAPDNTRTQVEVGDENGDIRTFHTSVVSDPVKLSELATAELEKLKYDGYRGSITSFLIPYATRGMTAVVMDSTHPNRDGRYFIKKVTTTFGLQGARRIVELGNKLS